MPDGPRRDIANRHIGRPDRLPPGQTRAKNWPVLHIGAPPQYDMKTWMLSIGGTVEQPVTLTWDQFMALPQTTVHADFHCVTTWSTFDNTWLGVSFRDIITLVKPTRESHFVRMQAEGVYDSSLPLQAMLDEDVLLCHTWNGAPLTPEHGGPLRTLIPKRYAWKSVKWLRALEFLAADKLGYWEIRGYSNTADPWTNDRFA